MPQDGTVVGPEADREAARPSGQTNDILHADALILPPECSANLHEVQNVAQKKRRGRPPRSVPASNDQSEEEGAQPNGLPELPTKGPAAARADRPAHADLHHSCPDQANGSHSPDSAPASTVGLPRRRGPGRPRKAGALQKTEAATSSPGHPEPRSCSQPTARLEGSCDLTDDSLQGQPRAAAVPVQARKKRKRPAPTQLSSAAPSADDQSGSEQGVDVDVQAVDSIHASGSPDREALSGQRPAEKEDVLGTPNPVAATLPEQASHALPVHSMHTVPSGSKTEIHSLPSSPLRQSALPPPADRAAHVPEQPDEQPTPPSSSAALQLAGGAAPNSAPPPAKPAALTKAAAASKGLKRIRKAEHPQDQPVPPAKKPKAVTLPLSGRTGAQV